MNKKYLKQHYDMYLTAERSAVMLLHALVTDVKLTKKQQAELRRRLEVLRGVLDDLIPLLAEDDAEEMKKSRKEIPIRVTMTTPPPRKDTVVRVTVMPPKHHTYSDD